MFSVAARSTFFLGGMIAVWKLRLGDRLFCLRIQVCSWEH